MHDLTKCMHAAAVCGAVWLLSPHTCSIECVGLSVAAKAFSIPNIVTLQAAS